MNVHAIKRACALIICCAALVCEPVVAAAAPASSDPPAPTATIAAATPDASVTPGPTPADTPAPTPSPTINVKELIASADLPVYEYLREGDSGDAVILLQQRLRDLGYFSFRVTGDFGSLTKNAVKWFQQENDLDADGVVGGQTYLIMLNNYAKRAPIRNTRIATPPPPPKQKTGKLVEWKWVKANTKHRSGSYRVIDVQTNIEYTMRRVGGTNHMDVEPATKKDTAEFKKTYGGTWSWERRPVIVRINGTWYAASINGMPHGYETVSGNNMTGQVCIHFLNSRTHGSNAVDSAHQRCVRKAAGR